MSRVALVLLIGAVIVFGRLGAADQTTSGDGRVANCSAGSVVCDDFGLSISNDAIHAQGEMEVPELCVLDIDEGKSACRVEPSARDAESDFRVQPGAGGELTVVPLNGATLSLNPPTEWSKAGCIGASYTTNAVRIDGLPIGSRVCIRTSRDRYAQIAFVDLVKSGAARTKMSFVTWQGKVDAPRLDVRRP